MQLEIDVHELRELIALVKGKQGWDPLEGPVGQIHQLGDPRQHCNNQWKQAKDIEWCCTLPLGHTGEHAAVGVHQGNGNAVVWGGS